MQNNQWEIISDPLPTKSPIKLKDNSIILAYYNSTLNFWKLDGLASIHGAFDKFLGNDFIWQQGLYLDYSLVEVGVSTGTNLLCITQTNTIFQAIRACKYSKKTQVAPAHIIYSAVTFKLQLAQVYQGFYSRLKLHIHLAQASALRSVRVEPIHIHFLFRNGYLFWFMLQILRLPGKCSK